MGGGVSEQATGRVVQLIDNLYVDPFACADQSTKVGRITHGAWSNPDLNVILQHFGKRAFARSSACMEFESFLKRIKAGGKRCVEIGSYHGITSIILSRYFDEVVSVSIDEQPPEELLKRKIADYLGITNIVWHDLTSNKRKRRLLTELDFDFAYCDGDHTNDALFDFGLVEKCGRVLFHEAWPIQLSVWQICMSLPPDEVTWAQYDCFAFWEKKHG